MDSIILTTSPTSSIAFLRQRSVTSGRLGLLAHMRTLMSVTAGILAVVVLLAFGLASVSRESEVAMHTMTDEEFLRTRFTLIGIGTVAFVAELLLLMRLFRRRSS